MDFKLGQPFRPYQQLMGVLPDRSKTIVPEPYRDLMTNPKSPILDFYPREFELDMNGKKMEWEAVVKIPFIDESRLLQAMATKDHLLSPEEKKRNSFGVSLKFTYAPDADFTYISSLPGVFPDLAHCRCIENVFDLPTMDGLDVFVGLVEGVKLGASALAGFPSLKTLPFEGALDFHGVNVFQQDSRGESMVVTILDSSIRTNVELAKKLLGKRVFVGYPFLSEAKVVRVSDELFDYVSPPADGTPPVAVPHTPPETDMWRNKKRRIETNYSKRLGIVIGEVESLVHVQTLKGLKKTDEGATLKEYAQIEGIETDFASQMIVREVISEDQRFLEKAALPIEEEFPEGSRAFFLGEFNYGRPLEIIRHVGTKVDVWISSVKGKEPEFGRQIAQQAERLNPYTPSYAVARMLNLNPLVLSKITSSFQVLTVDGKVNLGLNLKFEAKKLKVLGYSRRGPSGWEFSNKAIQLLQQYMVRFPHFIAAVQQNPQASVYSATELFPAAEAQGRIKEIQSWLKSIESKGFEKVPLDAEQLDSEVVMEIERAALNAAQNGPPVEGQKIKGVPRYALLKPSDAEHRLGNQRFVMGDRVVYVQDSGRVPIATRGTVVGLTRTARTTLLDVVFDVTFMSGSSLNDRCSPFHGSTVPISSVLNITDRQVIAESRATENNRAQNVSRPDAPSTSNGRSQLQSTNLPFHPSKTKVERAGNFRPQGVKNGDGASLISSPSNTPQTRGTQLYSQVGRRGRGNAHQSLSNQNNNISAKPSAQNLPNERPESGVEAQSYNSVPPPESLERQGRGQGRSRGRGIGRGRGRGPSQGQLHTVA
jgi:5'-3' exoribonuclease 1